MGIFVPIRKTGVCGSHDPYPDLMNAACDNVLYVRLPIWDVCTADWKGHSGTGRGGVQI